MSAKDKKALEVISAVPEPPKLERSPPVVPDSDIVEEAPPDLGKSTPRKKQIRKIS
jgi:hypothetical protein